MVWITYAAVANNVQEWINSIPGNGVTNGTHENEIPCGSVLVAANDSVQQVKTSILATNIAADRKRKPSKHALAIGSSFGHVHAFLSDESRVTAELDRKRSDDQCLMLIKKPKSSSKQMLKSQSWTNLSASDSHLYKQLDGGHPPENKRSHKYRMKKKQSELQPLPDELLSDGNVSPRSSSQSDDGGFLRHQDSKKETLRDKENRWTSNRAEKSKSDASTGVYPRYNTAERPSERGRYERNSRGYSSREINNNTKLSNAGRMYRSQNDIYSFNTPHIVDITHDDDTCTIKSDELYSPEMLRKPVAIGNKDLYSPGINETSVLKQNYEINSNDISPKSEVRDNVSRCHSLGDLTTGLTLSVVGQRKSGSIQNLPMSIQKEKNPAKQRVRNAKYYDIDENVKTNAITNGDKRSRESSPSEGFRNRTMPKICMSNQNLHKADDKKVSPVQSKTLGSRSWGVLPDKGSGLVLNKSDREEENSSQNSNSSARSSDKTPTNRTRRTLPSVPNADDKKRRYSEIMKMRRSSNCSNSESSNSRQSVMSPSAESQLSCNVEESANDKEVCNLTNSKQYREMVERENTGKCISQISNEIIATKVPNGLQTDGMVQTTLPSSVRSFDSGQTTLTSLSSTVDSGYLTTDAENDMYSSQSYTKSLQRSAHSFYSVNRLGKREFYENSLGSTFRISSVDSTPRSPHATPTQNSTKHHHGQFPRNSKSKDSQVILHGNSNCETKIKVINIGKGADMTSTPITSPQSSRNCDRQLVSDDSGIKLEAVSDSSFSSITSPQHPHNEERFTNVRHAGSIKQENAGTQNEAKTVSTSQNDTRQVNLSLYRSKEDVSQICNFNFSAPVNHENSSLEKYNESYDKNMQMLNGLKPQDKTAREFRLQDQNDQMAVRRNSMEKLTKCNITVLPSTNVVPQAAERQSKRHMSVPEPLMGHNSSQDSAGSCNRFSSGLTFEFGSKQNHPHNISVCDNKLSVGKNGAFPCQQQQHQQQPVVVFPVSSCDTEQNSSMPKRSLHRATSEPTGNRQLGNLVPFHNPVPQWAQPVSPSQRHHVASSLSKPNNFANSSTGLSNSNLVARDLHPVFVPPQNRLPEPTSQNNPNDGTVYISNQNLHHDYVNIPSESVVMKKKSEMFGSVQNLYHTEANTYDDVTPPEHFNTLPGKWRYHVTEEHKFGTSRSCPSLYQLKQHYDFHMVHIKSRDNMKECCSLTESSITLSALPKSSNKELSTPKGKCPKIGGPGSAFKPVKSIQSKSLTFVMVTVANVSDDVTFDVGGLQKGDILIEVNECWSLCEPLQKVEALMLECTNDLYLLIGRHKEQDKNTSSKNEEMQKQTQEIENLKQQVGALQLENQRKTQTIQDLTAIIPRKRGTGERLSKQTVTKTTEINGNIVTTDIIVNGLADDEFIV